MVRRPRPPGPRAGRHSGRPIGDARLPADGPQGPEPGPAAVRFFLVFVFFFLGVGVVVMVGVDHPARGGGRGGGRPPTRPPHSNRSLSRARPPPPLSHAPTPHRTHPSGTTPPARPPTPWRTTPSPARTGRPGRRRTCGRSSRPSSTILPRAGRALRPAPIISTAWSRARRTRAGCTTATARCGAWPGRQACRCDRGLGVGGTVCRTKPRMPAASFSLPPPSTSPSPPSRRPGCPPTPPQPLWRWWTARWPRLNSLAGPVTRRSSPSACSRRESPPRRCPWRLETPPLVAVGDARGRVAVLRPSPNVRCGGMVAAAGRDSGDAPPPDAAPTTPRDNAAPASTANSGTAATARDAARLEATLDWLRAAGAGY